ncbi:MAG: hypothetical protein CMJ81_11955 [Planctomycetaceae bacterium]|jgi:NAD(P)-dependent dehydrogenase (short-subunit alcohol dehydrogenase family)|nr:hypothetical protein [Planctomycetaceae bacterium]
MKKNPGDSSIIVASSGAGITGYAGAGPCIASKHAVNGLVKGFAAELADFETLEMAQIQLGLHTRKRSAAKGLLLF